MDNVLAVILGGGAGTRLYPLTRERAKPAVPVGGQYRLIDIPISNCVNSGLNRMFVLTLSGEMDYKDRTMSWSPKTGVEFVLWDGLAARWGQYELEEETEPVTTKGLGLRLRYGQTLGIGYDWARSDMPSETGDIERHVLTVTLADCDHGIDLRTLLGRYAGTRR